MPGVYYSPRSSLDYDITVLGHAWSVILQSNVMPEMLCYSPRSCLACDITVLGLTWSIILQS